MFSKKFVKKANQFRKQNWSAPTIMSVFIIVCMVFIYSFETIGLLNKEKNLDFRITTPEQSKIKFKFLILVIKTVSDIKINNKITELKSVEVLSEISLIDQLKKLKKKNKEENLDQMMRILLDGASQQYEYLKDQIENSNALYVDSEEIDIFDI